LEARSNPDHELARARADEPDREEEREEHRIRMRCSVAVAAAGCAVMLAGCGGKQSVLAPSSKQAHDIGVLWWWMLGAAGIVMFGAIFLLGLSWIRRAVRGLPFVGERETVAQGMVLMFGIGIPAVVLIALFGVANVYLVKETSPPLRGSTAMTIDVIGHQWWWEVRYVGTPAVTANEIHIPVNTRINVVARTADVIHSFWVPGLNRKIDMIPGYTNHLLLDADRTGVLRGQCAQFCGFQHANMAMKVFVQTPAAFRAWLANMSTQARSPATALARAGEHVFMTSQCESCHTIGGTPARGEIGPDLTHVASRTSLASDTIPNTPSELAAWIRNPQAIKPGVRMPDLGLSSTQITEVVAYLESLK
jgi:cytochrome c oxidase subunit 2